MSKELVIGSNRHETKVAILEEDQLVEVYFQRANEYSLAGSIHKGRVTRVLPGMQSAFVDLGLERDTFLYVSDFFEEHDDIDTLTDDKPVRNERGGGGGRGERGGEQRRDRSGMDRERAPQEAFAAPAEAQLENFAADEAAEDNEEEEGDAQGAVPSPSLAGEVRAAEQQPPPRPSVGAATTDRNDDGRGDRRGRRSRRRRRGGRDFPENKYARPSSGPAPTQTEAAAPVEGRDEPDEEIAEAVAPSEAVREDVILLPGESLAKYRTRPVSQAPAPVPVPVVAPILVPEPVSELQPFERVPVEPGVVAA